MLDYNVNSYQVTIYKNPDKEKTTNCNLAMR
jgi:uncharacterized protein (DUF927 family)